MLFLTNLYRYLKLGLGVICFLFGIIVITYGFADENNVPVVSGGVVMLLVALFMFIDGSKILADLRNEVNRLKNATKAFDRENEELKASNIELNQNIIEAEAQLNERKKQIKEQKNLVKKQEENAKEQKALLEKQSQQLEKSKSRNNELAAQIGKFQSLNNNMKTIILTMAQTMDQSNKLADALNQSIGKIEQASSDVLRSAQIMNKLQSGLQNLKFNQLDLNQDGSISRIEWDQAISQLN